MAMKRTDLSNLFIAEHEMVDIFGRRRSDFTAATVGARRRRCILRRSGGPSKLCRRLKNFGEPFKASCQQKHDTGSHVIRWVCVTAPLDEEK